MAASIAEQARRAVSSWRHTDSMQVAANPADVGSVTVRYPMYVLPPAWFLPGIAGHMMHRRLPSVYLAGALATVTSLIAEPYAEELWRCARARKR